MGLHTFTLTVAAEDPTAVRNLANDVQEAIRRAQNAGRHPNVVVVQGPTIALVHEPLPSTVDTSLIHYRELV